MSDRQLIFNLISEQRDRQDAKGKSFEHSDAVWCTILNDYLGRAVSKCYTGEQADMEMLAKALAVGVAWMEQRVP